MKKHVWVKIGAVVILVLMYFFIKPIQSTVKQLIFIFKMLDVEVIKNYILSFGIWAPVISFLLMIFQSIMAPLPAFLITFANASLFGWIKGALLSWSSAMVGAALCFYIARWYGRGGVEKLTPSHTLDRMDHFFKQYGPHAILIARLLPFISFDIVSYAAGLTGMSFGSFFLGTGIGQLPATIIYSYVGGMLSGGTKTFVMGLMSLFALSILIAMMKKMFTNVKEGGEKS